jgi:hypothetical protein
LTIKAKVYKFYAQQEERKRERKRDESRNKCYDKNNNKNHMMAEFLL